MCKLLRAYPLGDQLGLGLGLGLYFDIPAPYANTTFSWLIWQQGGIMEGRTSHLWSLPPFHLGGLQIIL